MVGLWEKTVTCTGCEKELPCEDGELLPQEEVERRRADKSARIAKALNDGDYSSLSVEEIDEIAGDIVLTTAFEISNAEIKTEVEIISAECVFGMNLFKDVFRSFTDIFGGRSQTTQNTLRDARKTVLTELRREAKTSGADAVIGVSFSYQEISGGNSGGLIMLVASGTAVRIER